VTQPDDPEETTVETMKWLTRRYLAVQLFVPITVQFWDGNATVERPGWRSLRTNHAILATGPGLTGPGGAA
jgi:hypothetical protein